jgi:hypothetical protein
MVRRPAPVTEVVPGTTPVIAFGDPRRAEVATLGINPSWREFLGDDRLLAGPRRRLATLESLSAENPELLTDAQIQTTLKECAAYFARRPYRRWFDPLDQVLQGGVGFSYYNGTACHLDLVQWATKPVWSKLPKPIRQALLEESLPHLRSQLKFGSVRLVVLNGGQILDEVRRTGLAKLELAGELEVRPSVPCRLYSGEARNVRFVGWSTNLQNSHGVSLNFRDQLARWLASAAG